LEISLYQEEAVINKKVVVTEQVEIGKLNRRIEHQYKITLQHEELDIEKQRPNSLD
jgi:stress response protein YsnF